MMSNAILEGFPFSSNSLYRSTGSLTLRSLYWSISLVPSGFLALGKADHILRAMVLLFTITEKRRFYSRRSCDIVLLVSFSL